MLSTITSKGCSVYFNDTAYHSLNATVAKNKYSVIFIIVDENTHTNCLPHFISQLQTKSTIEVIEIEAGEEHKNITTCTSVWEALSELGADRKGLVINLGGGVVTDLGGFIAATFMRGIDFINVPTSLLAMVDASVGGKTGIDLGVLKNQVGVIKLPLMVLIDISFLDTLPENQLKSGLTEMLKHGLIHKKSHWEALKKPALTKSEIGLLIHESIEIKNEVVTKDPTEKGLRKILNYGHTLGHAIESYCLKNNEKTTLLHGEAIAIGIILESYLSTELTGLQEKSLADITNTIAIHFEKTNFSDNDIEKIIELLKFDKKNTHGNINFVLLEEIGLAKIDCKASNELIKKAFDYYQNTFRV